jgi:hypothetical protein
VTRVTSSVPALLGAQSETVMKIDDGLCEYSLLLKMSGDPPFPLRMGGWGPISTENGGD